MSITDILFVSLGNEKFSINSINRDIKNSNLTIKDLEKGLYVGIAYLSCNAYPLNDRRIIIDSGFYIVNVAIKSDNLIMELIDNDVKVEIPITFDNIQDFPKEVSGMFPIPRVTVTNVNIAAKTASVCFSVGLKISITLGAGVELDLNLRGCVGLI